MKKTILLLLSSILLITIVFSSCNLDGTTGILWGVANSKAPLSIQYKQLLGKSGADLYFRTAKGVERVDGSLTNTPVVMSSTGNLIQAASLAGTNILYFTNKSNEHDKISVVDTTNLGAAVTQIPVNPTVFMPSELAINYLYANSTVLVSGKNGSTKVSEMFMYYGTDFDASVATFTMPNEKYGLENVIQQTGKEQDATAPMIVSFVEGKENGARQHYLVDPTLAPNPIDLGTENVKIANFVYKGPDMYVLSTDGKIYHVTGTAWSLIGTSSKTYEPNAFALAVVDGSNYHLITQPSSKTSALHVFTFPTALPDTSVGAGVDVKSGYAKEIALATIVSVHVKSPPTAVTTTLLVATDENGMFDISIKNNVAYKDIDANGSSSNAENYTF